MERKFVRAVAFSKGWAELALKKPPPLVPSSLMASWPATGPSAITCSTTVRPSEAVWGDRNRAVAPGASVCTTPWDMKIRASSVAKGSRM